MLPRARALQRLGHEIAFALSLLVFGRWVVGLRRAGTFVWPEVSPEALVRGAAPTPFQYRALSAWIARALMPWMGSARAAFSLIEALSAVGLVIAFRVHLQGLLVPASATTAQRDQARSLALLASPLVAAMIPLQYVLLGEVPGQRRYVYFPWDLPGAFGFMVCVSLLRTRRWAWFYPCFAVATLTRETTAFVPLLLLFDGAPEMPPRRLLGHLAAQGALWLAIKAALSWVYRHNPGPGAWGDTLDDNLFHIAQPNTLLRVVGCFAFLWVPTVLLAKRIDDRFTRRALWLLPVWFFAMMRVGNLYELRIFGELVAVVLPAWILALRGSFKALDDAPAP